MSSSLSDPLTPAGLDPKPAPGERTATHELWDLLRRPFNVVEAVDSVLGLSPNVVKQLTGAMLATCTEAEHLLSVTPHTIRSLSISMSNQPEECRGELRGPVLWSETFSCRSSSPGRNDVYVCAAPSRAYDIPENRVLVAALLAVRDAGRSVDTISARSYDDDTLRKARFNGLRASRLLEHRALSSVARHRPSPREMRRARSGNRRSTYTPALTMLARAADPLEAEDILPFCDRRTRTQHAVLVAMVRALRRRGLDRRALPGGRRKPAVRASCATTIPGAAAIAADPAGSWSARCWSTCPSGCGTGTGSGPSTPSRPDRADER